nr:MAG TPA: hypothetical protein [Herelleviridae sp.]
MKKVNYYVIGGQYDYFCYGSTPTLTGAKRLASKSAEYWDNWQGWHIPSIYRAEDVRECKNFYGATFCPVEGAEPVAIAHYNNSGRIVWEKK